MPTDEVKKPGPYVGAALFCDQVIQGKDDALSVIRIIDQVVVQLPPNAPEKLPPLPLSLNAFLNIRRGGMSAGDHVVSFAPRTPSGKRLDAVSQTITFTDQPQAAFNVVATIGLLASEDGVYWLDVALDGVLLTRVPIEIRYKRLAAPPKPT